MLSGIHNFLLQSRKTWHFRLDRNARKKSLEVKKVKSLPIKCQLHPYWCCYIYQVSVLSMYCVSNQKIKLYYILKIILFHNTLKAHFPIKPANQLTPPHISILFKEIFIPCFLSYINNKNIRTDKDFKKIFWIIENKFLFFLVKGLVIKGNI